jgi:hypothetical protein
VQAVDPARAARLLDDEPGALQEAEVPRDRRPADRQPLRELADGSTGLAARRQQLDDRPPVRIAERFEGVAGRRRPALAQIALI